MNQSHILFDTDKTAPTDDQGNAPQKAAGRQLADAERSDWAARLRERFMLGG